MRNRSATKTSAERPNGATVQRCAIYTRKSSEEGLEQEFNSLDAQREACEAFILSQKHTGWVASPVMYDDGGISGGTMERPALRRLLADIEAGRVNTVVVYKVDRLTRSLSDFAKIVDAFDAKGVSFVSVTQQFNTTTSMGRLTLNMLLSFAQFEREVTSERIRDKIAASKRKGMWMGGLPPLGYDVADRKLVINPAEADTVRHIFGRYAVLRSVRALKDELAETGIVSKARVNRSGDAAGGGCIARGALYLMLQNRLYRGEIVHKDQSYPGLHDAIVHEALWDVVQATLLENRIEHATQACAIAPSLLSGLVHDDAGERMSPTHANKNGTRYRYYVSRSLITDGRAKATGAACRVPAADLETIVEDRVCALLRDEATVYDVAAAATGGTDLNAGRTAIEQAADLARRWSCLRSAEKRGLLEKLLARVTVRAETVDITVRFAMLPYVVLPDMSHHPAPGPENEQETILSIPARLKRTGLDTKLLIDGPPRHKADRSLLRLLGQARRFHEMVMTGQGKTMTELAAEAEVNKSYFSRVFRLSFLAPGITQAIVHGRQPPELTAKRLMLTTRLNPAWPEQRRQFGLG
jgi:DNA invertase Pin-like site-specific DNA recombinase